MSKPTTALALMKDKTMVAAFEDSMAKVLPKHITPTRMVQVVNRQMKKTPKLGMCDPASFADALLQCSEMGLEPDGRHAHLVPYGKECTLIPDYKGLILLAREAEDVVDIDAIKVCANDEFTWVSGEVRHVINPLADRGDMVAAYTRVVFKGGHSRWSEPMQRHEVEKIMKGSQAWRYAEGKKKDSPWHTNFEAMWLKSVVRRDAKTWPLSNRLKLALDADDQDFKPPRDITPDVVSTRLDDVMTADQPEPEKKDPPKQRKKTKAKEEKKPKDVPTEKSSADLKEEAESKENEIKPFDQMTKDEMVDYLNMIHNERINEGQRTDFLAIGLGHLDDGEWFGHIRDFGLTQLQKLCEDIAAEFE